MEEITRLVLYWLSKNNIDVEGARIVFEFPTEGLAHSARQAIKSEVGAYMNAHDLGGEIKTMNGLGLTVRREH